MGLHAGWVHVWRADLDAAGPQFAGLLEERESARAARIVREPARLRWVAARGVLRVLLGAYLDEHPGALRFREQRGGKPALDPPFDERLHFNLSHSGGLAVYALTEMCAVGIDVELVSRRSKRSTHSRDFLRTWVSHEAQSKRLGAEAGNTLRACKENSPAWLVELDLDRHAVGALALARAPVDFQVYEVDFRACGSILPTGVSTAGKNKWGVSAY